MDNIHEMKLHETIEVNNGLNRYRITRVPGGWLYHYIHFAPEPVPPVFVPFSNEFGPKPFFYMCPICRSSYICYDESKECPNCRKDRV